jgi:hypothetical protein
LKQGKLGLQEPNLGFNQQRFTMYNNLPWLQEKNGFQALE